ncbi:hypothetical protein C6499_04155 [Candidatus Poribacteria bacterium]|nr:MAG: hypothetical protein C6499_04155 [Candidatus Poribacteria bacterium]
MKREDDVQLIHEILSGDEAAFSRLVQKCQKSVHALAWRKIGHLPYGVSNESYIDEEGYYTFLMDALETVKGH